MYDLVNSKITRKVGFGTQKSLTGASVNKALLTYKLYYYIL